MSSPVKAHLSLMKPNTSSEGSEGTIEFQFNPKEYTIQKSARWNRKPARGSRQTSMPQFEGSDPETISLELFLDASERRAHGIEADVKKLMSCVEPLDHSVDKNKPSPPWVLFMWGKRSSVRAFVKQVQVKYTMFKPDGTPLRAVCTVQLEEIPKNPGRQNPTSGSPDAVRSHTVVAGDSLASIAYGEYGTPGLWRAVAIANAIDDPMRLEPGARLLLPPEGSAKELAAIAPGGSAGPDGRG